MGLRGGHGVHLGRGSGKSVVGAHWGQYVQGLAEWQEHRIEGYAALVLDGTAFWRPSLKQCPSQHYHPAAGQALPAVIMGLAGVVGDIRGSDWLCRAGLSGYIRVTVAKNAYGRTCSNRLG